MQNECVSLSMMKYVQSDLHWWAHFFCFFSFLSPQLLISVVICFSELYENKKSLVSDELYSC